METDRELSRRGLIARAGLVALGVAAGGGLASCTFTVGAGMKTFRWGAKEKEPAGTEVPVGPVEVLLRGHGVLNRLLLVYEDQERKLIRARDHSIEAIGRAADLVGRFIENYHERLEEQDIFPPLEAGGGALADLARTLRLQHEAGRDVTAEIGRLARVKMMSRIERARLAERIGAFVGLYRPHAAREDTVLLPALRKVVSAREFGAMGERFEKRELELFGADGFGKIVAQVAEIEKMVGIDDLGRFTPALGRG